jgi:hypothetical protein
LSVSSLMHALLLMRHTGWEDWHAMTHFTLYRIAATMDMLCNRYRIPAKHIRSECGHCGLSIVVIRHGCRSARLSSASLDQKIVSRMAHNCI